ncbi:hypothetical protein HDU97_000164 [Phlyctochytrium planicorne]|nr:hypothetical protein HDU97_000164 [Phlyctochytrium planicorne]
MEDVVKKGWHLIKLQSTILAFSIIPSTFGSLLMVLGIFVVRQISILPFTLRGADPAAASPKEFFDILQKRWPGVLFHCLVLIPLAAILMITSLYISSIYSAPFSRLILLAAFQITLFVTNILYFVGVCKWKDFTLSINFRPEHRGSHIGLIPVIISAFLQAFFVMAFVAEVISIQLSNNTLAVIITNFVHFILQYVLFVNTRDFKDETLARTFHINYLYICQAISKTMLFLKSGEIPNQTLFGLYILQVLLEGAVPRVPRPNIIFGSLSGKGRVQAKVLPLSESKIEEKQEFAAVAIEANAADIDQASLKSLPFAPTSSPKPQETTPQSDSNESFTATDPLINKLLKFWRAPEASTSTEMLNIKYARERNEFMYVNFQSTLSAAWCVVFTKDIWMDPDSRLHMMVWKFAIFIGMEGVFQATAMVFELYFRGSLKLNAIREANHAGIPFLNFPPLNASVLLLVSLFVGPHSMGMFAASNSLFGINSALK